MKTLRIFALGAALTVAVNALRAQTPGFQFFGPPPPGEQPGRDAGVGSADGASERSPGFDLGIFARKPFTITASVLGGYNSNVNATPDNEVGSWFNSYQLGINYSFGTPRLQLDANVGGGLTYYYNTDATEQSQWNANLGLSATYLATERLTLSFSTFSGYAVQPNVGLLGGSTDQNNGGYFYTNSLLTATYQWTQKFSTTTSVAFDSTIYVDRPAAENYNFYNLTLGQSLNWIVNPRTIALVEYRISPYRYAGDDMTSLDQFFLAGVDFRLNPRLLWRGRVGAQVNILDNPVDGQSLYAGPYVESVLTYQYAQASNLSWFARYGTETSGIINVSQRQTFRTGITINHSFNRRLAGSLTTYWLVNYYDQEGVIESFYENIFALNASLTFAVNRFVSLTTGYQFTIDAAPERTGRNYTQHIGYGGINLSF